ncbi:MAG: hypothetical protein HY867_04055 [Chloroflexi bacterium]|nr:hypothetical protein [Chloroflexota bacterium]
MKIIKNEKLIKRNATIGQFTSIGALVILFGGMYISFTQPELANWSLFALILGFVLTQIGMYFGNRWGRRPRPDEKLDAALKGLPGDGILYHYSTSVPHLFVGAAGIWILLPFHQRGKVIFQKNRWKSSGGGFLQGYLRIFGQESIGRPDMEASHQASQLTKEIKKSLSEGEEVPPIYAALVFLDDNIEIESEGSPYPAVQVKKLKDLLRKAAKERPLVHTDLERVKAALPQE